MRIAELRWEAYSLPFLAPFITARSRLTERRGYILRLTDETGHTGFGEAAPLPEFGGEPPGRTEEILTAWGHTLPGKRVSLEISGPDLPLPAFGVAPESSSAPAVPPSESSSAACPTALHALEQALLDLASQDAGRSIAALLHPTPPGEVSVNATLGSGTPAAMAAAASQAVSDGFSTLKLKAGALTMEEDTERLAAVRGAIGPEPNLRIDANGAWDCPGALERLRAWELFGLEYAEQPVPGEDLAGMIRLCRESPVRVAADEAVRSPEDAPRLLEARAAHVLILKPMLLGGIFNTLRIARAAHSAHTAHGHGVPVVVTTVLESVLGRGGALQAAAVIDGMHRNAGMPGPPPAHGLATGGLLARDLTPTPTAPRNGKMEVTDSSPEIEMVW